MSAKEITRVQLVSTAKQINRIMEFNAEESINVKAPSKNGLTDDELKAAIKAVENDLNAEDFVANPENDAFVQFDEDAVAVFTSLDVMIPKKPAPIEKNELGKKIKPAPKTSTGPKYTRANAFADAIKTGETDLVKLLEVADNCYVEKGGKANIKEAKWYQSTIVPGLVALGYYAIVEGKLVEQEIIVEGEPAE